MKERPFPFPAPRVRATLEGRMTMTRRVITPQPVALEDDGHRTSYAWRGGIYALQLYPNNSDILARCPYGQPGDRLWVRETFATLCPGSYEGEKPRANSGQDVRYAATDRLASASADIRGYTWRPSIFMPRWASRILLEVTAVRVERVQDISEDDAKAEGIAWTTQYHPLGTWDYGRSSAKRAFQDLWDSINAKRGYDWDANPWVWVVEFKRIGAVV